MAQTGFTPIQLYSTSTAAAAPSASNLTNSTLGSELAINITDGKLFYKDNANAVQVIGWKTVPTTAGGTGLTTYTAGDLSYYATGTTFTKLAIGANTTILTSTGSAPQWSATSGITVGTATNLAGGLAGSVPYQTGAGATTFLGIGAAGRYLSSTGSAPQWSAPAALTEVDDTNVTMTLGGTPSTALLSSVSMTLGWTGQLAVSRGGTGTGTAFTAGSVIFAGASGVYSQDNAGLFFDPVNNKLAINTATVGSFLTVAGDGSFTVSGATATVPLIVANNNTSGTVTAKLAFQNGGSTKCSINAAVYNNGFMDFSVNNDTFAQRIHASGGVSIGNTTDPGATNLSVTGNVVMGTAGNGIDFSATPGTGTSELFADYEEGTFTATLTASTTGPTTPVTATARYTKVGNLVQIHVGFSGPNTTGASGDLQVTGLPFTSGSPIGQTGAVWHSGVMTNKDQVAYISNASTTVNFIEQNVGSFSAIAPSAGSFLRFSLTYFV